MPPAPATSELQGRLKRQLQATGLLPVARVAAAGVRETRAALVSARWYFFNNCLTHVPIHRLRLSYLRRVLGLEIGKASFIHLGARFSGKIRIGSHSVIGRNCVLMGDITIGANVSITAETYIFTSSHIVDDANFECFYETVVIEDYAWIGARAMILPGVRIGKGAVLAAASTATKDIPNYAIFAGSPAKEVATRSADLRYQLNYSPWFQ